MKIKPTYVTFEQTDEIWKDIIGYEGLYYLVRYKLIIY